MKTYCINCKKNALNENSIVRKLNKIDCLFYQIVLFVAIKKLKFIKN